jgi:hypothetical protein
MPETPAKKATLQIHSCADIKPARIHWIWKGYFAEGHITTFNGEPGSGKSLITVDIAARITTGREFPTGPNPFPPSNVLLLTQEEDWAATIMPRFLVAGGDPKRLKYLTVDNGDGIFDIEKHHTMLLEELMGGEYKQLIIDPLIDYTRAKPNQDEEVRPVLNKLFRLSQALKVCSSTVAHLNKKEEQHAIHRVGGCRAWTAVPRFNFLVGKGDNDLRHICPLKNNLIEDDKTSLDFRSVSTPFIIEEDGQDIETQQPLIHWQGRGTVTAQDLCEPKSKPARAKAPDLEDWIRGCLQPVGEWKLKSDLVAEAGVSERTVDRVAEKILDLERRLTSTVPPRSEWRLSPIQTGF